MKCQWTLAFVALFSGGILPAVSQTPLVSVKSEEVRIDLLATENGKPIRGLNATDFEVRDNGALQKIEFASFEQMPIGAAHARLP